MIFSLVRLIQPKDVTKMLINKISDNYILFQYSIFILMSYISSLPVPIKCCSKTSNAKISQVSFIFLSLGSNHNNNMRMITMVTFDSASGCKCCLRSVCNMNFKVCISALDTCFKTHPYLNIFDSIFTYISSRFSFYDCHFEVS